MVFAMNQGGQEEDGASDEVGGGAGKWCPACGTGWVDQLDRCPDCDGPLEALPTVEELPPPTEEEAHLEYELDSWEGAARKMLEQLLVAGKVAHAWQGGRLVVPERAEDLVDAWVEQVELALSPRLDPDQPYVVFHLDEWPVEAVDELVALLDAEELPWEMGSDSSNPEVLVHEADADRVEALVERIEHPDALDVDEEAQPGDEGVEIDPDRVLGGLYIATDRLAKDARDHQGVLDAVEHATTVVSAKAPYGFDASSWGTLQGLADDLLDLLDDDDASAEDEEVEACAALLRDALRPIV